jgi:hypothetical protein
VWIRVDIDATSNGIVRECICGLLLTLGFDLAVRYLHCKELGSVSSV